MTSTTRTTDSAEDASKRLGVGVALAPLVGWYDFLVFPLVALTYFGAFFFPNQTDGQALVALTWIWLLGYAMRPLGAIIFGAWGDRGHRTHALSAAVVVTALSTGAIGLLPVGGGWAVPALVILRALAGIGLGGIWSGSMVLAAEHRTAERSGFSAWPQVGLPLALLGGLAVVALFILMPADATLHWGWRLPFLGTFIFALVAPYILFGLVEPARAERALMCADTDAPRHRFSASLTAGILGSFFASSLTFFFAIFVLNYAGPESTVPGLLYLGGTALGAVGLLVGVGIGAWMLRYAPAWGVVLAGGVLASGAFVVMLILFVLVSINWVCLLVPAFTGAMGIAYAGLPTTLADAFAPDKRYTGVALVASLSGLPGALVPLLIYHSAGSDALFAFGWLSVAYLFASGLAVFGAMTLNMKRPDRSSDISPMVDEATPVV